VLRLSLSHLPDRPLRILAVGAHPDDIEIGAGGLLARLAKHGAEVTMLIASIPSQRDERVREAEAAARVLGGRLVLLRSEEQARVEDMPMHRLVAGLDKVVAEVRPQLVVTHSAVDMHWDHRLVHHGTVAALRRTPCDLLSYLSSPEMNAHARSTGQCFADITESIELKLAALAAHVSQLAAGKFDLEATRDLARTNGRLSGVPYAESFEVLRMTF
jgi:LmbE family N-acetylglucosaminyl deacetylase